MALKEQYAVAIVNGGSTTSSIAASATTSEVFSCSGAAPSSMLFSSDWTACNITFNVGKAGASGALYGLRSTDGSQVLLPTLPSTWLKLDPILFHDVTFIQIVCSTPQVSNVVVDYVLAPYHQGIHG